MIIIKNFNKLVDLVLSKIHQHILNNKWVVNISIKQFKLQSQL